MAGYRRGIWGSALCVVLLAAGCAGPAGEPQAARTQQAPRGTAPAAGIWLSSLRMTSASTGWALRWTVSPRSAQAGYLVPARTTDGARTWTDVTPRAAVALDALGGNRAYLAVTAAGAQNAAPLRTVVFGTGDGGRTWAGSAPLEIP